MALNIKNIVSNIFDTMASKIDGVVINVIYRKKGHSSYNPTTGKVIRSNNDTTIRCVWTQAKEKELQGIQGDKETAKIIFPALDYTEKPSVEDQIIKDDGSAWDIRRTISDPTNSVVTLILLRGG